MDGSEDELLISYDKPLVKLGRATGHAASAPTRSPARQSRSPAKLPAEATECTHRRGRHAHTDTSIIKAGSVRSKHEEDEHRPSPQRRGRPPDKKLEQQRHAAPAAAAANTATDTRTLSTKLQGKLPYPSPVSPVSEQERKHKREYVEYAGAQAQAQAQQGGQLDQHMQQGAFQDSTRYIKMRKVEQPADSPGNSNSFRSAPHTFAPLAAPPLHGKRLLERFPRTDRTPPGSALPVDVRSGGHTSAKPVSALQSPARIQKKQNATPTQRPHEQQNEHEHEHDRQKQVVVEVQVKSEPQDDNEHNGDLLGLFDEKSDKLARAQVSSRDAIETATMSEPQHATASIKTRAHQPKPLLLPPYAESKSSSPRKRPRAKPPCRTMPSESTEPATHDIHKQAIPQSAVCIYLSHLSRPAIPASAIPSLEAIFSAHGVKSQEELEVLIASPDEVQDYWLQAARGAGMSMLWESVLRAALRRSREEQVHNSEQRRDTSKHKGPT